MKNSKLTLIDNILEEQKSIADLAESLSDLQARVTQMLSFLDQEEQSLTVQISGLNTVNNSLKNLILKKEMLSEIAQSIESLQTIPSQLTDLKNSVTALQNKINSISIDPKKIENQLQETIKKAEPIFQDAIESYASQFKVKHINIGMMISLIVLVLLNFYMIYQANTNFRVVSEQNEQIKKNAEILLTQQTQYQSRSQ